LLLVAPTLRYLQKYYGDVESWVRFVSPSGGSLENGPSRSH
jgi:hypothetical protein